MRPWITLNGRCPLCGRRVDPPPPTPDSGRKGGAFDPEDPASPFFERERVPVYRIEPRSRDWGAP